MGVLSIQSLCAAVARAWQSSWLSAAVLVPFLLLAARGLVVGSGELHDVDSQVRLRLHFVHTTSHDVDLVGRASFFSLRQDGLGAMMIGPCEMHVQCRDADSAMLNLDVAWENAHGGGSYRLEDTATGATWTVDELAVHHSAIRVPLAKATDTVLRLLPSHPSLALRVQGVHLTTGPLSRFEVDTRWDVVRTDATGSLALGTGFWKPLPGTVRHFTHRWSYLRVEPAAAGPHLLRLSFSRPDPDTPLPVVTLNGKRVWCGSEGNTVWSRATTIDGKTTLEISADLAAYNVVGIECPGRVRSAFERGVSSDLRRLAYELDLDHCGVEPVK